MASRPQVTICEKPYLAWELFSEWRCEEQQTVRGAFLSQVISSEFLHQTSGKCFKTKMQVILHVTQCSSINKLTASTSTLGMRKILVRILCMFWHLT